MIDLPPDVPTGDLTAIARALRLCGRSQSSVRGRALHGRLVKIGLSKITFLGNTLISMYGSLQSLSDAQALFDEMPSKNVASWTSSMAAHCTLGNPVMALKIFSQMLSSEFEDSPNGYTFSAALKACALSGNLRLGRQIHAQILGKDLVFDTVLMNSLLDFYIQLGALPEARKALDLIPYPNTNSWNIMMNAYFNDDQGEEAERVFFNALNPDAVSYNTMIAGFSKIQSPKSLEFLRLMHRSGHELDEFSFPCALKACSGLRFGRIGRQIHCFLIKYGLRSSHCGTSVIQMYSSCCRVDEAEKLFQELVNYSKGEPGIIVAFANAMISGFVSNGLCSSALRLVSWIHGRGFVVDKYTLSAAARACAESQDPRLGLQIHGMMVVHGLSSDLAIGTLLMEIYTRFGNLDQATAVFDLLPRRDAIAWGTLISGCIELGSNRLGFILFKNMMIEESGASPDEFILSSVLSSRAGVADLEGGRQIHAFVIKLGFSDDESTATSLIDMYCKCGEVEDGLLIFGVSRCRDSATWTAIISGCAVNGRSLQALGFLREMKKQGVETNEMTFTGALTACRHGGLIEEACEIFKSMEMTPSPEHRNLMTDILGRGGCFKDAKDMLDGMPEKGRQYTWNALISGAQTEEDIRGLIGRHVDSVAESAHVTVSNALAGLGRWDDSALVRDAARRRGTTRKEAGVSRIEIKA